VRTINSLSVTRHEDRVLIDVEGNAFLHHMVRNIVGTLLVVGRDERPVEWVGEVLGSRDRRLAGVTAPAGGLALEGVRYPEAFGIPGVPDRPERMA